MQLQFVVLALLSHEEEILFVLVGVKAAVRACALSLALRRHNYAAEVQLRCLQGVCRGCVALLHAVQGTSHLLFNRLTESLTIDVGFLELPFERVRFVESVV